MLEPGEILLVVFPALRLQLLCREVLLVGTLLVIEDEEEGVEFQLCRVDGRWGFREACMAWVGRS
jgi:hypothetical protein